MADQQRHQAPVEPAEDVVLLRDLAPRGEVKGGGKLRFGEPPGPQAKLHRR